MTNFQRYALANPLARANGRADDFRRFILPCWSIILTVNK